LPDPDLIWGTVPLLFDAEPGEFEVVTEVVAGEGRVSAYAISDAPSVPATLSATNASVAVRPAPRPGCDNAMAIPLFLDYRRDHARGRVPLTPWCAPTLGTF
jgi:hypothetical protein